LSLEIIDESTIRNGKLSGSPPLIPFIDNNDEEIKKKLDDILAKINRAAIIEGNRQSLRLKMRIKD